MKSLKEQREKLFQEKLAEMADIGVKKRTGENTPDFDDPIDLDDDSNSVEEDKSVSLQGYYGQEDKISKDIPLDAVPPILLYPRSERETPEQRIFPLQWIFRNMSSVF